jgi:hypothetical protein
MKARHLRDADGVQASGCQFSLSLVRALAHGSSFAVGVAATSGAGVVVSAAFVVSGPATAL